MQDNQFENEDYPLIVTPSRWASSSACKDVTVAPRNSQPTMDAGYVAVAEVGTF